MSGRPAGRAGTPAAVFFPGGRPAPQMPFGLIARQDGPHLRKEAGADPPQPTGDVLVYRRFAIAERGGGRADGGAVLHDVLSQQDGPPLRIASHTTHPSPMPF